MARFALKLLAPAGKAQDISAALRSLARSARREWGCLSFDVYACVEDENRIFMLVDWSDRRALAAWVRSDDFTHVLAIVEISAEPPAFEFRIDDEVRGLDYVAEVRDDIKTA